MSDKEVLPITNVVVHPIVLLSAVDHFNRVAKNTKKRVVGVLLGEVYKGKVDVLNSYAVPFEEDRKDSSIWYLDHCYSERMYDMTRKVNAKEKIVGWYSTGPKIRPADIQITEAFRKYTKHPLLVIVNVQPTDDLSIPTEAYISVETQGEEKSQHARTFRHIPSEIGATEPEEIGVEHLLRDIRDKTVSTLTSKIDHKAASLKNLDKHVQEIHTYLEHVLTKRVPPNPKIIYNLQDIFNLMPNLNVEELAKAFAVKSNDMMMTVYLSSLIRSIIALHNLINNLQMNKEHEMKEKEDKSESSKNKKKDAKKNDEKGSAKESRKEGETEKK
eukprot:215803_1